MNFLNRYRISIIWICVALIWIWQLVDAFITLVPWSMIQCFMATIVICLMAVLIAVYDIFGNVNK